METIERPDNWEGRPYAREDGWTDAHRAFRDWLMNELVQAGCEVRILSPMGMAQVTVEHMVRQGWAASPPTTETDAEGSGPDTVARCNSLTYSVFHHFDPRPAIGTDAVTCGRTAGDAIHAPDQY